MRQGAGAGKFRRYGDGHRFAGVGSVIRQDAVSDSASSVIRELEFRLLERSFRNTPALVAPLLAEDFCEFGSSGHVYDKSSIVAALADDTSDAPEVFGFEVAFVGKDVVLVTYHTRRRDGDGGTLSESLRSSIWCKLGDGWKLRFHQGTRTGPMDTP